MKYDHYFFENMFLRQSCEAVSNLMMSAADAGLTDNPASGIVKTSRVLMTPWKNCKNSLGEFEDIVNHVNNENFGFHIYKLLDPDIIHYNVYNEKHKSEYSWHSDGRFGEMHDYKLTAIVNLSTEPYEGGKFELFSNGPKHVKEFDSMGSVIIFPSLSLIHI